MPEAQPIATVGFIGLGRMGLPMAANLLKAGFRVRGFDTANDARDRLSDLSGVACLTAAETAAGVDALITMLPNDAIVQDVLVGGAAVAAALREGAFVIDMSSSSPIATRELGALLAKRRIGLIDAPVSGGVGKAETGALAIMAGGDAALVDRARPLFDTMGSTVFATGPLGSGHAMKALNNYVSAAGLAAACEALIIGAEFGLSGDVVVDVLNASTGRNNSTENKLRQFILSGNYGAGFAIGLMAKDIGIAAELAKRVGRDRLGVIDTARLWSEAASKLGGGQDHTAIYRYLDDLNHSSGA